MTTQDLMIQSKRPLNEESEIVSSAVSDFHKRYRNSVPFRDIANSFFVSLPDTEPIVVLVLDEENVILDIILLHHTLTAKEQDLIAKGQYFTIDCDNDTLPFVHQRDVAKKLLSHPLKTAWNGGVMAIRHPTMTNRERRMVLFMPRTVSPDVMLQMLTSSAYAIFKLWCGKIAETELSDEVDMHLRASGALEHKLQEYERFSSLASLSAGIAHEIRNPLTTARGFLQLFEQRCAPDDKRFLQLTIHELDRIQQLLVDFMGLSRPDQELVQTVDARTLIKSVYDFLSPEASLRNVKLEVDIPTRPVMMDVQVSRIKQVLINLVKNGIDACQKNDGTVSLAVRQTVDEIYLSVSDTGCGIPDTRHLFDPFHTTKTTGTGLGLFVSKHIVEDHGGHIEIESKERLGTTITVSLPIGD